MNTTIYIPIGTGCGIAQELKRRNLRMASLPFDWVYTWSLEVVNQLISDEFKGLFIEENWIMSDDQNDMEDKDEVRYINTQYKNFYSIHDFKKSKTFKEQFPEYCNKMERRVKRFFDTLKSNHKIIFIRDDHHFSTITKYNTIDNFKSSSREFNKIIKQYTNSYNQIYITEYINENVLSDITENLNIWYVHSNNLIDDWRRLVIPWDAIFHHISLLQ